MAWLIGLVLIFGGLLAVILACSAARKDAKPSDKDDWHDWFV